MGAGLKPEDRVVIGIMAGQHDDRRLEAALAQQLHRLAAIHVRQTNIHDQKIDMLAPGRLHTLGGRGFLRNCKFLVERKLFDEGFPQVIVIVYQQDRASGHCGFLLHTGSVPELSGATDGISRLCVPV